TTLTARLTSLPVWLLFVALTMLALSPLPAQAKYASLVIDAATGEVLNEVNADTRNYPASLTKMMTLYLVFEALEEGRMRLDDRIMMTRHAANQPPSRLGLAVGESLSAEDAIRALAIKSANDVAAAVAEHVAGSEKQFALLMTAKARNLGMSNTTFRNASGLPHRAQMSTARDMSKLARAMLQHFPHYYHYFSEEKFTFNGKVHKTHNKLLTDYEGTDGIKTGYIHASGFNLVASVKRGDKRLIGVVFGANNPKARNLQMVKLMEKGWSKVAPQLADHVAPAPKTKVASAKSSSGKTLTRSMQTAWGVQVGAFNTHDPAYDIAVRAIGLAPNYLGAGDVTVEPLEKKNGRVLYRGRVVGITKTQAYRACSFLKKKNMGCLPLKLTNPQEVASLN
ncbi:MAG TPA: D-alanyl-D-alanine carboxypeptidase family protein, partial [Magnetovibrio sp.]